MKQHPILFSAPMVRAVLDGTKTQTRRTIKTSAPRLNLGDQFRFGPSLSEESVRKSVPMRRGSYDFCGHVGQGSREAPETEINLKCPFGIAGDQLWVKETFSLCESRRGDGHRAPLYRATALVGDDVKWKPSIFMPRWASRITLEIVKIRIERLNEISREDAAAEGVGPMRSDGRTHSGKHAVDEFADLWDSINGPHTWEQNPWVWVVEFKRITPP